MARPTQSATNMRVAATLMGFTALTLAVVSSLHLGGILGRHTKPPFQADDAGIAEAVIGIVLLIGALAIVRRITQARRVALGATVFAIAGFVVGLTFTLRGGDAIDVVYHCVMLPVLLVTLLVLLRDRTRSPHADSSG